MLKLRQSINAKITKYDEYIRVAKSEKVAEIVLRDKRRWLCRNDLFYLCCLMGNEEIKKYPEIYQPFCEEVSLMNWLLVREKRMLPSEDMLAVNDVTDDADNDLWMQRLFLAYRTFYKTTIISKVHSLQLMLNFPNIHICLSHNKQENASDNLVAIKNYFLTTSIRRFFPEFIPPGKEWGNMSGFSVGLRTDWGRSEATIEAVGVGSEIVGRHYTVAKKNDLVTQESVGTEEQIKKTVDWDNRFNLGNFDDPQYKIQDYEGTRYHHSEMYAQKKNDNRIKLFEIKLLKDGDINNICVENIHNPRRFSVQSVKDMTSDMWTFNCQMLQIPDDPARMQFKNEMLVYYSAIPAGSNFYLLVDPASRRKKKSDWTVMLVVGLGWYEDRVRKFIVDGVRDKLDPKQRVDMAIGLAKRWNIKGCGWEAVGFQETDCFYLEEKRRLEKLYFTIEEIDSHKVSKEDRIRGLLPDYANHNWLWPQKGVIERMSFLDGRKFDLTTEMEFEMMQFPLCEHDDLLDTMTFLNRIVTVSPPELKTIPDSTEMTFGEYTKIRDERLAQSRRNPWAGLAVGVGR